MRHHGTDTVGTSASNGVHGAISSMSGPSDLSQMQDELQKEGDIGSADSIGGAYYAIVDSATVATLNSVQQDDRIKLVDVGRLQDLLDVQRNGECARFALPDPIWYAEKNLAVN